MIVFPHLILKKENQILLPRRSTAQKLWPGHWHCVTGSIENGESPRDTIIREAEEEIGITPQNPILNTTIFLTEKDYFDPLQKFRYAHKMPPEFQNSFIDGLAKNNIKLPTDWRTTVHLLNLSSLIDLLKRSDLQNHSNRCADIRELIDHI
ncbi:MAG: hypothetical protein BGO07_04030 [Alphaproteobacteria bacterium 40-19]|nr:MAG: hypothetical protein BGO07_04030 [Alphaproteobacteria bacterium 40-19]